jgi:argininosuccinate synthase
MGKVVVACFGDQESLDTIQRLSASADVVVVAMDLGGAVPLAVVRDLALAAGAIRCHAVDVREDFTRTVMLPAIHMRAYGDATTAFAALAPAYVERTLQQIAALEHATVLPPGAITLPARRLVQTPVRPQHFDLTFVDGLPTAINGVTMTLPELMESIETITGEPALCVIEREMTRSREPQIA